VSIASFSHRDDQLAFPPEGHEEATPGRRLHLPLQLFWGKVSMAVRGRNE
jgi:hypothetical protein